MSNSKLSTVAGVGESMSLGAALGSTPATRGPARARRTQLRACRHCDWSLVCGKARRGTEAALQHEDKSELITRHSANGSNMTGEKCCHGELFQSCVVCRSRGVESWAGPRGRRDVGCGLLSHSGLNCREQDSLCQAVQAKQTSSC